MADLKNTISLDEARNPKEQPRHLFREMPPADPYPIDTLDGALRDAVIAIQDKVQAPLAMCAQSVLSAATLAVQAHADVVLPTGQVRPLSEYFVTVGESGERKSACDNIALWPIAKHEMALREERDAAAIPYRNDKELWDHDRRAIVNNKKMSHKEKQIHLEALGPEPEAPLNPMLTSDDPTYEGLVKGFPGGQPSVGLFTTEGGQFVGGYGMSAEHRVAMAAGLSMLWDGEPVRRVRGGDGSMLIPGRRFSIHIMIQPELAPQLLADRMLIGQGLLSRTLVVSPESTMGTRYWREPRQESEAAIKRYGARLLDILERKFPLVEGKLNELSPRELPLSQEARQQWKAFADHVESQVGPHGDLNPIKGLANKLPEHAARLAGVMTLVANIEAVEVAVDYMGSAIELTEFYANEALRLYGANHCDPDLLLAAKTLDWLKSYWDGELIPLSKLYQLGPSAIRDAGTAKRIVNILEGHGWLISVKGGATIDGIKYREVYEVYWGDAPEVQPAAPDPVAAPSNDAALPETEESDWFSIPENLKRY